MINKIKEVFIPIKSTIKLGWRFSKKLIIILIIINLILGVLPFINLINTQNIINSIQITGIDSLSYIKNLIFIFFILGLVYEIFKNLNDYFLKKLNDILAYKFLSMILEETKYLSLKDYEDPEVYDLLQRAEQETGIRPIKVITSLIGLISSVINIVSSITILAIWHSWSLVILTSITILSSLYFLKINENEFLVHVNRTKNERKTWYITHLLKRDVFIKEVKILNLYDYLLDIFKNYKKKFVKENFELIKKRTSYSLMTQIVTVIIVNIISILAIFEAINGFILIGNMTTIINSLSRFEDNIRNTISILFSLHQDSLYLTNITKFLEYTENIKKDIERKNCLKKIRQIERIDIKNLSYKYKKDSKYVLKNLNLSIEKGEKIAIIGENGSGKSTLIKILTNLYEDFEGDIYINEISLNKIDKKNYKNLLSVVFQDYNNYQFTIKESIGFGDIEKISDIKSIIKASKDSGASEFINKLPFKYEQQLGNWFEKGMQLSGGQWQKLAISRAFFKTSDVYIFDEPTASLDAISEYKMFKSFNKNIEDKIGIFITHRFNNVIFADKIIVLDKGKIVEIGTHEELMNNKQKYYKFYNLQNGKNLIEI